MKSGIVKVAKARFMGEELSEEAYIFYIKIDFLAVLSNITPNINAILGFMNWPRPKKGN